MKGQEQRMAVVAELAKEMLPKVNVADELKSLGLEKASRKVAAAVRMRMAYDNYEYVPQEKINAFNEKLQKETMQTTKYERVYKQLVFIRLEDYDEVPPPTALKALKAAKESDIFDRFEVAKIADQRERVDPDPILFGRVDGCDDRFFIAQWDDDVSIEEILAKVQ